MSRETEGAVKNNKFSLYKKKLKYGSIYSFCNSYKSYCRNPDRQKESQA